MLDKYYVGELYLQGYNAVEIAHKLKANVEATRKCIQRNFSDLKEQHIDSLRIKKREVNRATNREATKYISDRSFVLKNRSIYKTKSNGDIVLNKEVAGNVTWDTPRILPNTNKAM